MEQTTGGTPVRVRPAPRLFDLRSTEVPVTTTRDNGTVETGVIHVVHAPGAPVPDQLHLTALPETAGPRLVRHDPHASHR